MRHPVLLWGAFLLAALLLLTGLVLLGFQLWVLISDTRRSRAARRSAQPVDAALSERAAAVIDDLAAWAGVTAPPVRVVPLLGVPLRSDSGVGVGGLAVTRALPGQPVEVVFAAAAITRLSSAALGSLAAHELAHVVATRSRPRNRYVWMAGYLALAAALMLMTVTTPDLLGFTVLGAAVATFGFHAVHAAVRRREEVAADLFALDLTGDLGGAEELIRFNAGMLRSDRGGWPSFLLWLARVERWVATHPEPHVRLAAMRRHLERGAEPH